MILTEITKKAPGVPDIRQIILETGWSDNRAVDACIIRIGKKRSWSVNVTLYTFDVIKKSRKVICLFYKRGYNSRSSAVTKAIEVIANEYVAV